MSEPQPERRSSRRFALRLPLAVTFPNGLGEGAQDVAPNGTQPRSDETQSRDVSARGICFFFDVPPATGSDLEFTLTLPPEITATDSIHVQCKGRVVRVEKNLPNGKMAVAAVINEYAFLPEA